MVRASIKNENLDIQTLGKHFKLGIGTQTNSGWKKDYAYNSEK